jgi:hypothetical protein
MKQLEINIHLKYVTLKEINNSWGRNNCRFLPWKWQQSIQYQKKNGSRTDSKKKIGTLFDLLTMEEDSDYENRFNVDLLASRLIETTEWHESWWSEGLSISYFGQYWAASALRAAAYFGDTIKR